MAAVKPAIPISAAHVEPERNFNSIWRFFLSHSNRQENSTKHHGKGKTWMTAECRHPVSLIMLVAQTEVQLQKGMWKWVPLKIKCHPLLGTRCNPLPCWIPEQWSLKSTDLGMLHMREYASVVHKFSPRNNKDWKTGVTIASHVHAQLPCRC